MGDAGDPSPARPAAPTRASLRCGVERRLDLNDGRVMFVQIERVEGGGTVVVLPLGCAKSIEVAFDSIEREATLWIETFARYRAICERQRRGVFITPTRADDRVDDSPVD